MEKQTPESQIQQPTENTNDNYQDAQQNDATQELESIKSMFPSWGDLCAIIGVLVLAIMAGSFISLILSKTTSFSSGLTMFICYTFQFLCAIFFALWQKQRKAPKAKLFNFSLRGANPGIILYGFCLVLLTSILIEPLVFMFDEYYFEYLSKMIGSGGWVIITAVICAPILEEVLFRGIIQSSLTHRKGQILSILISSAIFGAIHIIPPQAINAFVVSIVLGFIFSKSGSLLTVIIIHSLNNAVSYLAMSLNDGQIISTRSLIQNQTTYQVLYLCSAIIFCLAIFLFIKRIKKQTNNNQL